MRLECSSCQVLFSLSSRWRSTSVHVQLFSTTQMRNCSPVVHDGSFHLKNYNKYFPTLLLCRFLSSIHSDQHKQHFSSQHSVCPQNTSFLFTSFHHLLTIAGKMSNDNNSDNNSRPRDNADPPVSVETLMQSLLIPDSNGTAHSFLYFHKDLQSKLRGLELWSLALLGFYAAMSLLWNDKALQEAQLRYMYRFIPESYDVVFEDMLYDEMEKLVITYEIGCEEYIWYWMFRQDPTQPRQVNKTSKSAPPKAADERPQADNPSKRRRLGPRQNVFFPASSAQPLLGPFLENMRSRFGPL